MLLYNSYAMYVTYDRVISWRSMLYIEHVGRHFLFVEITFLINTHSAVPKYLTFGSNIGLHCYLMMA